MAQLWLSVVVLRTHPSVPSTPEGICLWLMEALTKPLIGEKDAGGDVSNKREIDNEEDSYNTTRLKQIDLSCAEPSNPEPRRARAELEIRSHVGPSGLKPF